MIERRIKTELLALLEIFPVVAIVGARQVGKTTLAKTLQAELPKESIYLDLESPQDANKLRDPEHYLGLQQDKTVILDEVQRMPELFNVLRSLIDRQRVPGRFIVLGSASPDLLRQSSETLAGRIAYLEMHPIDFTELTVKDFRLHWLFGGFPMVVTAQSQEAKEAWIDNFIKTYVERDLARLGLNIESVRLQKLLLLLAGINGVQLNKSMIASSLQISVPTVSRYIDFLEGSFLLRSLQPYDTNLRKRVSRTPKIYFRDTGVLHGILGISSMNDLFGYERVGSSWESYVLQQLLVVLPKRTTGYYFQTQSGAEVDLVVVKGNKPIACFEMKMSTAPDLRRGNREAMELMGTDHNYIVAPVDAGYPIAANIWVVSLSEAIEKMQGLGAK
jgi:hypothetical protein